MYFPLIVREALMVEFTESETKENIDKYVNALKAVEEIAEKNPDALKGLPSRTAVSRVDSVKANHPKSVTPTFRVYRARLQGAQLILR